MQKKTAWALAVASFVVGLVLGGLVVSTTGLFVTAESEECREARERLLSGKLGGADHADVMRAYELACQE